MDACPRAAMSATPAFGDRTGTLSWPRSTGAGRSSWIEGRRRAGSWSVQGLDETGRPQRSPPTCTPSPAEAAGRRRLVRGWVSAADRRTPPRPAAPPHPRSVSASPLASVIPVGPNPTTGIAAASARIVASAVSSERPVGFGIGHGPALCAVEAVHVEGDVETVDPRRDDRRPCPDRGRPASVASMPAPKWAIARPPAPAIRPRRAPGHRTAPRPRPGPSGRMRPRRDRRRHDRRSSRTAYPRRCPTAFGRAC